jgi:Holliday junction resolvase-like predicted endonuclease
MISTWPSVRLLHVASLDDLVELEAELDDLARGTRLTDLSRRSVLTGLLSQSHFVMYGGLGFDLETRPAVGAAMINRFSYLLDLLDQCPEEPIGASAADAFSPYLDDPTLFGDLLYLVQYGHLCELLPEVRRGWYVVSGSRESGFRLDHPSEEFAESEARDTILADVSLPFSVRPPPNDALFDGACISGGLPASLIAEVALYVEHYRRAIFEVPLFDDAGWQDALGVAEEDFLRFRAFWLAWAEVCFRIGEAVRRRLVTAPDDKAVGDEYIEWVVPYLNPRFIEGLAITTAGLSGEAYDRLTQFFTHAPGSGGGEGFFPPLHMIGDGLLFAPAAVQMMLASRNIAYALNKTDPDRFAAMLSHHLEPFLLARAAAIFGRLDVEVRTNVSWSRGEIDLLAYDPASNVAVHVQAKAPVPPQGARMTRAVESRAREGLQQLAKFRSAAPEEVDQIVGSALGRPVADVAVRDMLIVRTCLGTHKVWAECGDVSPANLHVLAAAVDRLVGRSAGLGDLPFEVTCVLDELVADIAQGWEHRTVDFALATIEVPLLQLNEGRLGEVQRKLHHLVP